MKKIYRSKWIYLSFITIFILLSCGIPNIYVPNSSDCSSSKTTSFDSNGKIVLSSNLADSDLNKSGFPKLALFYQIIPVGPDSAESGFNSVVSDFNSLYCDSKNGQRISSSENNQAYHTKTYKYNSELTEFGLYQFKDSNGYVVYFDQADLTNLLNGQFTWNLDFDYGSEEDSNDGTLILKLLDHSNNLIQQYSLKRFNDKAFNTNESQFLGNEVPTIMNASGSIINYKLRVYALVNTEFNDFSNVYNTTLKTIGDFQLY